MLAGIFPRGSADSKPRKAALTKQLHRSLLFPRQAKSVARDVFFGGLPPHTLVIIYEHYEHFP